MLAIEVEYLLRRSVASDTSQRDRPEWPPHPSRLFSALVDALADVRNESRDEHARCEAALRWLETLPPPKIAASIDDAVSFRTPVKFWVPINDETAERLRSAPLVEQRKRQERFFPAAVPAEPIVVFMWPDAEAENHGSALDRLIERVPYLGHSSSLVRVARRIDPPEASLSEDGADEACRLRVPGPGRLERLNAVHDLRKRNTLVQPPKGREVVYRRVRPKAPQGPLVSARVISFEGLSLGLEDAAWLAVRYRAALLSLLGDDAPSVFTGHDTQGGPLASPHIAYVPLANVDHRRADGSIKGLAVLLPRAIGDEDVLRLDQAMSRLRTLHFGARGDVLVRPLDAHDARKSLDFRIYTKTHDTWASVTPVALSLHPKPKKGLSEESVIRRDFVHLGLPEPAEVYISDVPFIIGAARARKTSRRSVSALDGRLLRHVHVRFARPVTGPLLVGAGRYMGLGLLLPTGGPV